MLTTFFDILVFIFLIVFFWTACIKNICREIISKYNFTTTKKCTSPNLATLDCSRSCVGSGVRARELNIHCSDTSERPTSQISWFAVFTVHCGARGGACYIRVKQTFSHNCHEWETEIELATSGGHDTGESTTYIHTYIHTDVLCQQTDIGQEIHVTRPQINKS